MFNKNNYTNNFNQFFIDYQRRFIHFASTYVHDEAVAEDFVIESIMLRGVSPPEERTADTTEDIGGRTPYDGVL